MDNDAMSLLRRALGENHDGLAVNMLEQTDSTNLRLKEAYRAGEIAPPYLLVADSQTAGRGRLGRVFVSPPGTGLYMSLLGAMPPHTDAGKITVLAAVAVSRAIEELTTAQPKIKWVNDLFVNGRKICGILAEGVGDSVIVGVGVNLRTPPGGFPKEAGLAGALDREVDAATLAGRIACYLLTGLENPNDPAVIAAYRARMPLIGQTVQYTQNGQQKNARVTGVDEDGGLRILGPDGPETLRCGEVTLGSEALARFF